MFEKSLFWITFYFFVKSNERSEDFYIGLADFFCFFFEKIESGKIAK